MKKFSYTRPGALDEALKLQPVHPKSLWLAGIAARSG